MMHFTVDAYTPVDSCQRCCCERLNLVPGTTSKVTVGYAPWAAPIGRLHCVPQFAIEPLVTCPTQPSGPQLNDPPVVYDVTVNTPINIDLALAVTGATSYTLMSLYGPTQGTVKKMLPDVADGKFTYTPVNGYTGSDRFFVSTKDDANNTLVVEVLLGVGISGDTVTPTPPVSVGPASIDYRLYTASFAVSLSPAAKACDTWRLTVRQAALDCDCTCYTRNDCFDIGVAKC